MHNTEFIKTAAEELLLKISSSGQYEFPKQPFNISKWAAVSLLQKAIRRGETSWALKAADTLLIIDPSRLYRRLSVIAVEDIGIGDFKTVEETIAGLSHRHQFFRNHQQENLIAYLVTQLANAPKCRATDDLYSVTEYGKGLEANRQESASAEDEFLFQGLLDDRSLVEKAIKVRCLLGTRWPRTSAFLQRSGSPMAYFDYLVEIGYPASLVELSKQAFRLTGEPICGFLPLVYCQYANDTLGKKRVLRSDVFETKIARSGVPTYAYDQFTREGKGVLKRFLSCSNATTRFLNTYLPRRHHARVLSHIHFYLESGLLKDRMVWHTGNALLQQCMFECTPLSTDETAILIECLRDDLAWIEIGQANV